MSEKNSSNHSAESDPALYAAVLGLQRLAELFERRRRQLAREVGLSDPQWRVLEQIASEDFMPSMFARARETSAAAVSRTLRQLLERELVGVSIGSEDARQRQYTVTARGRRVLTKLRERREEALDTVWSDFSRSELQAFARFSERLADRLEAYAEDVESRS
jgi:DNA-binding MarR family transcriptional regulator